MDLAVYRASPSEQSRISDLLSLIPPTFSNALDIGARDGYVSKRLAEKCERVTAVDLSAPNISHEKIEALAGDVTSLTFADNAYDLVLCAEVLEHIPPSELSQACHEIARVTRRWAIIGVPLEQDIRFGSMLCPSCGKENPPWGHVNSFSVDRLRTLFSPLEARKITFVGSTKARTNALSHALMRYAGHPFGTYSQDETCVYCGGEMHYSDNRTIPQRLATRAAHILNKAQQWLIPNRPMWVHILFEKI